MSAVHVSPPIPLSKLYSTTSRSRGIASSFFFFLSFSLAGRKLDRDGGKLTRGKVFGGVRRNGRVHFSGQRPTAFSFYPAGIISFFLSIPARRRSPVAFSVMISFQFLLLSPRLFLFILVFGVPRETKLTRIFPDIWCDIYIYIYTRLCGKSFTKSGLEICVKKVRGKNGDY